MSIGLGLDLGLDTGGRNAAPTFVSISPSAGPTAGSQAVTLTLTGAVDGASLALTIGGASATSVTWVSSTSVTAVTPSGTAGAKDILFTNGDGQTVSSTNAYTYVTAPALTSISTDNGSLAGGTVVTFTGTNFTGATGATIGGVACTSFSVTNSTTAVGTTAAHAAGLVDATITTSGGTATKTNCFYYFVPGDMTGVISWGRADLGITESSGRVSAWADQTGTNHFTQATGGKQPLLVANAVNTTRSVVRFTTSRGDYATSPSIAVAGFAGLSCGVVAKITTKSSYGMFFSFNSSDELRQQSTDGYAQLATSLSNGCAGSVDRSGAWHVFVGRHNYTGGAVNINCDSTQDASDTGRIDASTGAVTLGGRGDGFHIDADVAEWFIANIKISDADLAKYVAYSQWRYGTP